MSKEMQVNNDVRKKKSGGNRNKAGALSTYKTEERVFLRKFCLIKNGGRPSLISP